MYHLAKPGIKPIENSWPEAFLLKAFAYARK